MKIIFAGTPEFAVPSLRGLYEAGHEITVLTQPDKPQGRKGILTPSPVKSAAEELGLKVLQPARLKEDFSDVKAVGAELMVTCAYGQILTQEVLDLFPKGVWNVHASLLPKYRGAAPIAQAIISGEEETGVTIMRTDVGLDTGDTFLSAKIEISPLDTCDALTGRLSLIGAKLIVEAVDKISRGDVKLIKQGEGFVCKKVHHTEVDFSRSAKEVCSLILGLSSAPLSYATVGGLTLNFFFAQAVDYEGAEPFGTVLSASPKTGLVIKCGEGAVKIEELQAAGGKRMLARDFLNGRKIQEGMCFDKPVL
ncbi:MAG: methionyl-tRNA formyltransferase [Clostridia bacterium]|nr:methionyl-tRNA formyltransferase [Clostridia bacterium]